METTYNLRGHLIDKQIKAVALSRPEAQLYEPLPNSVLISYAGNHQGKMARTIPAEVKKRYRAVLEMPVDDISPDGSGKSSWFNFFSADSYHAFDQNDYQRLHTFIETYQDCYFVVHCDAGISRSSATALYIAKKYAPQDYDLLTSFNIYYPNVRIFGYLSDGAMSPEIHQKYSKLLRTFL